MSWNNKNPSNKSQQGRTAYSSQIWYRKYQIFKEKLITPFSIIQQLIIRFLGRLRCSDPIELKKISKIAHFRWVFDKFSDFLANYPVANYVLERGQLSGKNCNLKGKKYLKGN